MRKKLVHSYRDRVYIKYQIFPMKRRRKEKAKFYSSTTKKIYAYNLCVNTVSIQRGTNQPRLMVIFPFASKKWPRFLVFNNHTRVAVFYQSGAEAAFILAGLEAGLGRPPGRKTHYFAICLRRCITTWMRSRVARNVLYTKIFSPLSKAVLLFIENLPVLSIIARFKDATKERVCFPPRGAGTCSRLLLTVCRWVETSLIRLSFRCSFEDRYLNPNLIVIF